MSNMEETTKLVQIEVPLSIRERLIARANRNRRSMRGEALAIIEAALWHDEAVREDPDGLSAWGTPNDR